MTHPRGNIRSALDWTRDFCAFGREERNLAAIFVLALLNKPDNTQKFLSLIGSAQMPVEDEFGIYVEYSYLRDLWWLIRDDSRKRDLISQFVGLRDPGALATLTTLEFNQMFGAVPIASSEFIQSPGNWSLRRFHANFLDNNELLNVCRFKWSFNAKPDVVIHTSRNSCICIEAKLESGEGSYPQHWREKEIFTQRGLRSVGQTELQRYAMEELLGYETECVYLVRDARTSSGRAVTVRWRDAFAALDLSGLPNFARAIIDGATSCGDVASPPRVLLSNSVVTSSNSSNRNPTAPASRNAETQER